MFPNPPGVRYNAPEAMPASAARARLIFALASDVDAACADYLLAQLGYVEGQLTICSMGGGTFTIPVGEDALVREAKHAIFEVRPGGAVSPVLAPHFVLRLVSWDSV